MISRATVSIVESAELGSGGNGFDECDVEEDVGDEDLAATMTV